MIEPWPPAIGICGHSNSGKTSLIEALIRRLTKQGLRVGAIKCCSHRLDIDPAGKDSDRLFGAGADVLATDSSQWLARTHVSGRCVCEMPAQFGPAYDVVLVEGGREIDVPKVWLSDGNAPPDVDHVIARLGPGGDRLDRAESIVLAHVAAAHTSLAVAVVILIGGRSARMGSPKSLLQLDDGHLLARIVREAQCITGDVLLAGEAPLPPGLSALPRLPDPPEADGPIAGLLAAFRHRPAARWLALSCDLPFLSREALEWVLDRSAPGFDAVLPHLDRPDRPEPLLALYEPGAGPLLERAVRGGEFSMRRALKDARVHSPAVPSVLHAAWTNVNTPAELAAAMRTRRKETRA